MPLRCRLTFVLLALLAISCRQVEPLPPGALQDLDSLAEFTRAFNADAGEHRLLVLLSPT